MIPDVPKSTTRQVFINLVKTYIGAGTLGLPFAFRLGGLLGSALWLTVLCLTSTYCIHFIIKCKQVAVQKTVESLKNPDETRKKLIEAHVDDPEAPSIDYQALTSSTNGSASFRHDSRRSHPDHGTVDHTLLVDHGFVVPPHSFADVGQLALGDVGGVLVEIVVVTCQLGFVCAYLLIIGDTLNAIMPSVSADTYILILAAPLTCLVWIRSFRYITPLSIAVLVTFSVGAFAIIFYGVFYLKDKIAEGSDHHVDLMRWVTLPLFFGTAVYAFEGINLAIPIEDNMMHPEEFPKTLNQAMIVVMIIFLGFGGLTYYLYGTETEALIILCLSHTRAPHHLITFIQIAFCVILFLSYPVGMQPIVQIIENRVLPLLGYHSKDRPPHVDIERNDNDFFASVVVRSLTSMAVVFLALVIPNFEVIMEMFGAFSNALATFSLPAIFSIIILKSSLSTFDYTMMSIILVLGVLAMVVSSYYALLNFIHAM